jgi:hypothetical protein
MSSNDGVSGLDVTGGGGLGGVPNTGSVGGLYGGGGGGGLAIGTAVVGAAGAQGCVVVITSYA